MTRQVVLECTTAAEFFMANRYFDLTDDVYISGRWDLGRPLDEQGQKMED